MRGASQRGLLRLIIRIRSRTPCGTLGRPGLPRPIFHVQNKRKPLRCQATTVSALTIIREDFQSLHTRRNQTQKIRSADASVRRFGGRVGERATTIARPTLPSSNRRCRFPASGSPVSSRLRHAQYPTDEPAPTSPSAAAIVLLAEDGMAAGCVVANVGVDGPERSARSHSRRWRGTRRKSSSSNLAGVGSALRSVLGLAYGTDDGSSFRA